MKIIRSRIALCLLISLTILLFLSGCDMTNPDRGLIDSTAQDVQTEENIQLQEEEIAIGAGDEVISEGRFNGAAVKVAKHSNMNGPTKYYYFSAPLMHDNWTDGSRITDSISSIHVKPGYEAIIYRYTNYTGDYKVLKENSSPTAKYNLGSYRMSGNMSWNDRVSSIEIRKKIHYPTRFQHLKNNPKDSEFRSINVNEIQGVANNGKEWFLANEKRIYKCSKHEIRSELSSTHTNNLPSKIKDYDHFGDLDYHNGRLYVPLYKQDSNKTPVVVVYNSYLKLVKYVYFPKGVKNPGWVSINPINRLLYVSDGPKRLKAYDISDKNVKNGQTMKYRFTVDLNFGKYGHSSGPWWDGVWNQGAEFGPDGLLYYVLDHKSDKNSKYTGIYIFDITARKGKAIRLNNISYDPARYFPFAGWKRQSELEGITYWDRGSDSAYPGQIHALFLDLDGGEDDCTFMHFKAK